MRIFKPHEAIDIIADYLPENPNIVEAGAFNGTDSIKMALRWPHGTIHAFEPVPEIYATLVEKTKDYTNIHCYQQALSDANGTASFHIAEKKSKPGKASQAGSLLTPNPSFTNSPMIFPRTIEVPTITLDTWAQEHSISHIDLLWLDMQGKELDVLRASPHIVKTVRVIVCEVSLSDRYTDQFTLDQILSWAQQNNFSYIARDFDDQSIYPGNIVLAKKINN